MTRLATRSKAPSAVALRRAYRSGRGDGVTWRERLAAAQETSLYLFIGIGSVIAVLRAGFGHVAEMGDRIAASALPVHVLAAVGSVLGCAVLLRTLLAFGPVVAREAERYWMLNTPVDRRGLLSGRFAAVLVAVPAGGSAVFGLLLAAAGLALPVAVAWAALGSVSIAGVAVVLQPNPRLAVAVHGATRYVTVCGVALSAVLLLVPSGSVNLPEVEFAVSGTAVFFSLGTLLGVAAYRRLGSIDRVALSAGAELARAAGVSTRFLDTTTISAAVTSRWARTVVRVRSRSPRGGRAWSLIRADLARIPRRWERTLLYCALLLVPCCAGLAGLGRWVALVQLVAAFLAVYQLAGGLRQASRSPALRRAIGGSDREIYLAHLAVPALGAVLWCGLGVLAVPGSSVTAGVVSAVAAVTVTYRFATKPQIEYSSAALDMGFGSLPVGLLLQLARGPLLLTGFAWLLLLIGA